MDLRKCGTPKTMTRGKKPSGFLSLLRGGPGMSCLRVGTVCEALHRLARCLELREGYGGTGKVLVGEPLPEMG